MALHFAKFLGYTIGHLEDLPLPPPAHTAETLREQALDLIEEWSQQYGDIYPQLRMGYRYVHAQMRVQRSAAQRPASAAGKCSQYSSCARLSQCS